MSKPIQRSEPAARWREPEVEAALLMEPGRIEIDEVEDPVAGPSQALVRIRTLGICGTDHEIFRGSIPVAYPRIMGHEVVGEVLEGGSGHPSGTRVIVHPSIACGKCRRCSEGRTNICEEGWLLGRDRDGGFRELMTVPAGNLYALPDDVDDRVAPLIQVLTTCVHAQRMVGVFPGESVAIVGLGVGGLLHLQLAKLRGAWPVVCLTRSERKLQLARDLGADVTIRATDGTAVEQVREATGGGADVSIECAGTIATLGRAVELTRSGGRILAFGTIAQTRGPFPFYELYHKELAITNARAARGEDFPVAIHAAASGHVQLAPLVTHQVPLASVADVFRDDRFADALKVVVEV